MNPTHGSAGTLNEPDECVACGRLTTRATGELCYPLCLDCEITARIELVEADREDRMRGGQRRLP